MTKPAKQGEISADGERADRNSASLDVPVEVAVVLAELNNRKPHDSIYDCAAGYGSFLIKAVQQFARQRRSSR
jgi:hypothetical protein